MVHTVFILQSVEPDGLVLRPINVSDKHPEVSLAAMPYCCHMQNFEARGEDRRLKPIAKWF